MGVLDDLIKIKSVKQEDDLLKLLDEISIYEKLSANEAFKDLKTSKITREKCPLLASFADGSLYTSVLAELAADIYRQIEGQVPDVINITEDIGKKRQRQREVLKAGIVQIEYQSIIDYNHEEMQPFVIAVYTKEFQALTVACLIVKLDGRYIMYHGSYESQSGVVSAETMCRPLNVRTDHGYLILNTYSVLGNNGYPFAVYMTNGDSYQVMIDPSGLLYLLGETETKVYELSHADQNTINTAKKDANLFASAVGSVIERVIK